MEKWKPLSEYRVYNINIDKMVSLREWVKKTKSVSFA